MLLLVALALAASGACGAHNPTRPVNHSPIINSVNIFPATIGPTDSAIIVVSATDPDGDSLVYDWITDDRIRLRGARPGDPFLYNTSFNAEVIYTNILSAPLDTAWVSCGARDRKGGGATRTVLVEVHN